MVCRSGRAPGNIPGKNRGTLNPKNVDLITGMLRLTLTQSVSDGLATSEGAEIRSKQLFGYGSFVWVARAASTSDTPNGVGSAVSGTVTDFFNFIDDSETEIDFEYQGTSPSTLEMTNFSTVSNSQSTNTPVSGAESSFHEYRYVWRADRIEFYVDGKLVSTHTEHIPSSPAAVLINLWGTNSSSLAEWLPRASHVIFTCHRFRTHLKRQSGRTKGEPIPFSALKSCQAHPLKCGREGESDP